METVKDVLKRYLISRRGKVQVLTRLEEAAIPLTEKLGHFHPDQIDQMLWDDYAANRFRKPNSRSSELQKSTRRVLVLPGTLRREFNVLWAALRLAWKDGFLVRLPSIETPRDSAPHSRFLTKSEARKLLDVCEDVTRPDVYCPGIVYSGMPIALIFRNLVAR